ncbi:MAG TPA: hypothetical protein ENJ09_15220 [Planctomycetes bacterium]|nr:hypothetical protein [Planctomycetota bacterium]
MHSHAASGLAFTLAILATAPSAHGQASDSETDSTAPPTVQELLQRIERLERARDADREDFEFELEGLEDDLSRLESKAGVQTQRSNVFNPGITVFGNFLARADDQSVHLDDDPTAPRIDDQFNLREFEVDYRASIDPWTDGVLIATYESETPGEANATIEEGYVIVKKLPVLDSAPAGLKLKMGRFRPNFGRFNQIHTHDLPQPTYPRALGTFLGPEGYIRDGVEGKFFLPSPSESQTIEATVGLFDGGELPIAPGESASNLSVLGHVKWFKDLGKGRDVELGVSGLQNDSDHRVVGLDGTYKWKPFEGGEWKSFLVGGEFFQADLSEAGLDSSPMGYYLWSQYQFDKNLYFGVRYYHAEDLTDASMSTDTYGAYLTFYTTEFFRLRFGMEHSTSDIDEIDGRNTALLETNFIFGSHPVEPYWVNR